MANLTKVVQHLRQERDQALNGLDQLDEALKALTGIRELGRTAEAASPMVRTAEDHVGQKHGNGSRRRNVHVGRNGKVPSERK